ncbi:DUF4382 domain-containing protein [Natronosalvus rutilus]|uniref:DUF4382 domain-containing protein n=1 Tax=Natronosalvus rutilus TaxID=2953753 RepID=A0A9E7N6J9_9EURY|nr:DUF4382 domain-containing protein [Natronosalvus rutilus]UTF52649.1 DUF4382 domain-containing protein [Natronosalvus rutilus]
MPNNRASDESKRANHQSKPGVGRRAFIAAGGSVGATALAGCTSGDEPEQSGDDGTPDQDTQSDDGAQTDGSEESRHQGNFRLLVSDMPADIGDFERLDVTLDYARIFDGGRDEGDDEDSSETEEDGGEESNETEGEDADDQQNSSDDGEDDVDADGESDEGDEDGDDGEDTEGNEDENDTADGVERKRGFYIVDLEGRTVDLTELVGERAVSVFEGELSPGTYEKIELHVSAVEGIVDGEQANVKLPSEKLQITHPFEIGADDPVDFVFDINVVKRGQGSDYNLKPVISESGVAGKDVEIEEVERDDRADGGEETDDQEDEESNESEDADEDTGEEANESETDGDGDSEDE